MPLRGPATPWLHPTLAPGQTLTLFDNSILGNIRHILGVGFAPALRSPLAALGQIPHAATLAAPTVRLARPDPDPAGVGGAGAGRTAGAARLHRAGLPSLVIFNLFYGIGDIDVCTCPCI